VRGQRLLIADLFGPHGNAKAAAGSVEACRASCFSYPLLLLGMPASRRFPAAVVAR